ncbi:hypothetical protein HPY28_19285 [Brevibacillus sp. HB1.2]|uniref:hypothetical protein n=1 Tax=Brevibacillus sp. HB1.2 TaxID=2738807 RepID=UPI0015753495|nr:hypothetical protein [Brevibacillus sp. HB1.2]NTU22469.1 hypothetical protein [Brevibacillus sp. HB1.2]
MLLPNLPTKTMGGKMFWNTLDFSNGWKLQQNLFTGHLRILDQDDVRQAWGLDESNFRHTFRNFVETRS